MSSDAVQGTDPRKARSERLAQALRANLTRRKAAQVDQAAGNATGEDAKQRDQ